MNSVADPFTEKVRVLLQCKFAGVNSLGEPDLLVDVLLNDMCQFGKDLMPGQKRLLNPV